MILTIALGTAVALVRASAVVLLEAVIKTGAEMEKGITRFGKFAVLNWIMLWVIIINAMIVMIPDAWLGEKVSKWIADRNVLWLTGLLTSISYFLSHAICIGCTWAYENFTSKSRETLIHNMVACLDFTEKAVLREFVLQRRSVINLPVAEPAVKNLLDAGILTYAYGTPAASDSSVIKALMISLDARQFITYKILGLSKNGMTEEQIEQILHERPKFATKKLSRS